MHADFLSRLRRPAADTRSAAGADVDGVTTSGWGHVHTVYRDTSNDDANSVEQQAATGMAGGPGGAAPGA